MERDSSSKQGIILHLHNHCLTTGGVRVLLALHNFDVYYSVCVWNVCMCLHLKLVLFV